MNRIKSSREITELIVHTGTSYRRKPLRITVGSSSLVSQRGHNTGRVAFIASKKLGNAVKRNRLKRMLRVAAQQCGLPRDGYDIILFATPYTATTQVSQLTHSLESLLNEACYLKVSKIS